MHILVTAATTTEIQPTLDFLARKIARSASGAPPPGRNPSGNKISTLITGVGTMATTWSLMRQLGREHPDLILQAGIAGCFRAKLRGEVVVVEEEVLADLGVWETQQFKSLFDLNLMDANQPPFLGGRLVNPHKKLLTLTALERVMGHTVNEISTDPDRIRWYQQNTAAVVESMEGGGLHYVGLRENIAFLQLRSVSNAIGVRDKTKWDFRSSIDRLNQELILLLEKLDAEDETVLES